VPDASSEKALGKAIQLARQEAGLTQQELCHKASLSYSTLAKIERGAIKTPSVFTVMRIANILEISIDGLMGAAVDANQQVAKQKKTSKTGVAFLYLDINGCLVHFFHSAFTKLSQETGIPSDVIETTFWHYNDAVCRGEMTMDKFNDELAHKFGLEQMDWTKYYMDAVEPIPEMHEFVHWAAQYYKVGLLSNIMPGFVDLLIENGKLPSINYEAIIDSSQVGTIKPEQEIFELAQKKAGVDGSEILFVDDSRTNLMAAERKGWKVLWFDDYHPVSSLQKIRASLVF